VERGELPFVFVEQFGGQFRQDEAITNPGYHNQPACYSRAIAYFSETAMLISKRRFSAEHVHRFFRGRDSMKVERGELPFVFWRRFRLPFISGFALLRPPAG
jgi:hypothetical protein